MSEPKYFSFNEMTATSQKLPNSPKTWEQITNLYRIAFLLDEVRVKFGKPIRVNCAFRSPEVNKAVGGVAKSAHLDGRAADICSCSGSESDNRELLRILDDVRSSGGIDQLISYHKTASDASTPIRFIHVGICPEGSVNRCQRLYK